MIGTFEKLVNLTRAVQLRRPLLAARAVRLTDNSFFGNGGRGTLARLGPMVAAEEIIGI